MRIINADKLTEKYYDYLELEKIEVVSQIEKYFSEFLPMVKKKVKGKNLRDKDRYLWAKSFYEDLRKFLR